VDTERPNLLRRGRRRQTLAEITSKRANSYQFKTGDLATNDYVEIVRQRAAACPNVEDIGARGEVLFVYFYQKKYVVKALGDLVQSFSTRTEH
jgi:hypothetical protein